MRSITEKTGTFSSLIAHENARSGSLPGPAECSFPLFASLIGEACPQSSNGSTASSGPLPSSTCASVPVSTSPSALAQSRSDRSKRSSPRCSAARAPMKESPRSRPYRYRWPVESESATSPALPPPSASADQVPSCGCGSPRSSAPRPPTSNQLLARCSRSRTPRPVNTAVDRPTTLRRPTATPRPRACSRSTAWSSQQSPSWR